jgi:cathepsin F
MRSIKICLLLLFVALICTQEVQEQDNTNESQEEVVDLADVADEVQPLGSPQTVDDDATLFDEFQNFMHKYNKKYASLEELNERFVVFSSNFKEFLKTQEALSQDILANSNAMDEGEVIQLGVTSFFDLTEEQYRKKYLGFRIPHEEVLHSQTPSEDSFVTSSDNGLRHLEDLPESFDWRSKGVVTPVKEQGECGSCFAFSVAANLESLYAMKNNGKHLDLSEQQLVNCDKLDWGCDGGFAANAFKFLKNSGGMGLESSLKYTGKQQKHCKAIKKVVQVEGYRFVGSKDDATIAAFLNKNGPLSAAVNAGLFKYYRGGVMNYSASVCSDELDHAITLVGYGVTSGGVKYWIIKNSWGNEWGEKGYIRLGWGVCGVNTYVLTGILAA